jgi:spermidine synthase
VTDPALPASAARTWPERARGLPLVMAAFTGGAAVLAVELAASRVLAPFFGNSLYVWGALIGVVLAGLAAGYWLGGALADRWPHPGLMVGVLALGGLAVLAVPLVDAPVLQAVVDWDPGPRLDPLLAATILFGPPSLILAAVTPVAVRLRARSLASLGRTAGRLFAVSTAGSIAGTFATAFWLVPELGVDQLFAVAAAALLGAAALYALAEREALPSAAAFAGLAGAVAAAVALAPDTGGRLSAAEARNWSPLYRLQRERGRAEELSLGSDLRLVYRKDTRYHRLSVVDDSDSRFLRFDSSFQSGMYLRRPFATRFRYTDFFNLGLAYDPSARDVLFVGLGGASAPKRLWRDFPEARIEVAELDPVVVDVARRYFRLPDDPRLHVTVEDGRRFLAGDHRRWDVIAIDAFFSDSIPFHMTTREFLELAHERLAPGGVIVTNVIGSLRGSDSRLFRAMYRTYASVFPTVLVHPVIESSSESDGTVRNLILVATDAPAPEPSFLGARWQRLRAGHPSAPDLTSAIRDRWARGVPTDDVPLLTDDYAPTDALLLD